MPLWRDDELLPERVGSEMHSGLYFLAECDGEAAGTVRFQLEDPAFWSDVSPHDSAFIHRLAVRRRFEGCEVSSALLRWAVGYTRSLGKQYLRLDCEASRLRLRALYERFGFTHHSDRQVGPYFVSRYDYDVTKLLRDPSTNSG
jgi:GNAT superfamily N-acetyltransferase